MNPFTTLEELFLKDEELRAKLIKSGELFSGYHPKMEELQIENGKKLQVLIEKYGWPVSEKYGNDIEHAAWMITMHAISLPELQKQVLALLKADPIRNTSPECAMLEDRILVFSGRKQKFGTQFDWDENGLLHPFPIENPEDVDNKRKQVGLEPLELKVQKLRECAIIEGENPPLDLTKHTDLREQWMLRVGWISDLSEIDPAYDKYRPPH
jgi:hypothetical protein